MTSNRDFRIPAILVLSTFIYLFALAACENDKKGYSFKGVLSDTVTGSVYLEFDSIGRGNFMPDPIDTAVLKNGRFEFTGSVPYPMNCYLTGENKKLLLAIFVIENSDIILDTVTNSWGTHLVKGSKNQAESEAILNIFELCYSLPLSASDSLRESLYSNPNNSEELNDSLYAERVKASTLVSVACDQKVIEYVRNHSSSYGALYGWEMGELWEEGSTVRARRIFETFDTEVRNSPYGISVENLLRYYESMQVGQPAPELNLMDSDGKRLSLSSYRGKRVIIFANPDNAYFSAEDDKVLNKLPNTVIIAVDKYDVLSKVTHTNVYDINGLESSYRQPMERAPAVFVIDENGMILAKGSDAWKSLK